MKNKNDNNSISKNINKESVMINKFNNIINDNKNNVKIIEKKISIDSIKKLERRCVINNLDNKNIISDINNNRLKFKYYNLIEKNFSFTFNNNHFIIDKIDNKIEISHYNDKIINISKNINFENKNNSKCKDLLNNNKNCNIINDDFQIINESFTINNILNKITSNLNAKDNDKNKLNEFKKNFFNRIFDLEDKTNKDIINKSIKGNELKKIKNIKKDKLYNIDSELNTYIKNKRIDDCVYIFDNKGIPDIIYNDNNINKSFINNNSILNENNKDNSNIKEILNNLKKEYKENSSYNNFLNFNKSIDTISLNESHDNNNSNNISTESIYSNKENINYNYYNNQPINSLKYQTLNHNNKNLLYQTNLNNLYDKDNISKSIYNLKATNENNNNLNPKNIRLINNNNLLNDNLNTYKNTDIIENIRLNTIQLIFKKIFEIENDRNLPSYELYKENSDNNNITNLDISLSLNLIKLDYHWQDFLKDLYQIDYDLDDILKNIQLVNYNNPIDYFLYLKSRYNKLIDIEYNNLSKEDINYINDQLKLVNKRYLYDITIVNKFLFLNVNKDFLSFKVTAKELYYNDTIIENLGRTLLIDDTMLNKENIYNEYNNLSTIKKNYYENLSYQINIIIFSAFNYHKHIGSNIFTSLKYQELNNNNNKEIKITTNEIIKLWSNLNEDIKQYYNIIGYESNIYNQCFLYLNKLSKANSKTNINFKRTGKYQFSYELDKYDNIRHNINYIWNNISNNLKNKYIIKAHRLNLVDRFIKIIISKVDKKLMKDTLYKKLQMIKTKNFDNINIDFSLILPKKNYTRYSFFIKKFYLNMVYNDKKPAEIMKHCTHLYNNLNKKESCELDNELKYAQLNYIENKQFYYKYGYYFKLINTKFKIKKSKKEKYRRQELKDKKLLNIKRNSNEIINFNINKDLDYRLNFNCFFKKSKN